MASINEYAQLSAAVYAKTAENRIVPPADWVEVDRYQDHPVTGFAAGVFRHRATGEIVIAYAGSQDVRDWAFGNVPAAAGEYAPQVRAAMELYVRARQRYGDNIRFTGHSLGGGLAGLMAVYFDRPAVVFQTAPFEASAFGAVLSQYAVAFAAAGIDDAAWRQYLAAGNDGTLSALFAARERQVAHVYVSGEVLAPTRTGATAILNPALETALASGAALANGSTPRQLHSMLLAWSMLANPEFGAQLRRLPRLYGLLRDARLFDRPAEGEEPDLHALLMQREGATGMLTRFTDDVRRIADGFADKTPAIADALIAATMAFYYAKRFGVAGDAGEATAAVPGGLQLARRACTGLWPRSFARRTPRARERRHLAAGRMKARSLQQRAEVVDCKTRVLDDAAHRDGIDRIVARDRQDSLAVAHHDVLALTHDPEAGLLQSAHCVQMVDAGKARQGYGVTSISRTSRPLASSSTAPRYSRIASRMLSKASCSVVP